VKKLSGSVKKVQNVILIHQVWLPQISQFLYSSSQHWSFLFFKLWCSIRKVRLVNVRVRFLKLHEIIFTTTAAQSRWSYTEPLMFLWRKWQRHCVISSHTWRRPVTVRWMHFFYGNQEVKSIVLRFQAKSGFPFKPTSAMFREMELLLATRSLCS